MYFSCNAMLVKKLLDDFYRVIIRTSITNDVVIEVNGDPTDLQVSIEKGERRGSERKKYIRVSEGDMVSLLVRHANEQNFDPVLVANIMVSLLLE